MDGKTVVFFVRPSVRSLCTRKIRPGDEASILLTTMGCSQLTVVSLCHQEGFWIVASQRHTHHNANKWFLLIQHSHLHYTNSVICSPLLSHSFLTSWNREGYTPCAFKLNWFWGMLYKCLLDTVDVHSAYCLQSSSLYTGISKYFLFLSWSVIYNYGLAVA